MVTGIMMITIFIGGSIFLEWILPERVADKLLHILHFD